MKHKLPQPYRNPSEYQCYLHGVTECAKAFGFSVDSLAWGAGVPNDLTLYVPEDKPEPKGMLPPDPPDQYVGNPQEYDGESNSGA